MRHSSRLFTALRGLLFLLLLLLLLAAASFLTERKASLSKLRPFFHLADQCDVLFVGDSLTVTGILPGELWRDCGITGYNLASYGNTMAVSYWSLVNALDHASPEVVVIDVSNVDTPYKLTGSSADVHTALDHYPLTLNKIRALEDLMNDPSSCDDSGIPYTDLKWEYYFKLAKYHSRWKELSRFDLFPVLNRAFGAQPVINVAPYTDYTLYDDLSAAEEGENPSFLYLRRMITACLDRNIRVLLVHMPYPASEEDQRYALACCYLAEEYGIDWIDFVYDDQAVDYMTDCYDTHMHLNPSGAQKVTAYLGDYLRNHYALADHRGDPDYRIWSEAHSAYLEQKTQTLEETDTLASLLMLLRDSDFSAAVSLSPNCPLYDDEQLFTLMHNIVREPLYEADAYSRYSNSEFPLTQIDTAYQTGNAYTLITDHAYRRFVEYVGDDWHDAAMHGGLSAYDVLPTEGTDLRIRVLDPRSGNLLLDRSFSL